MTDPLIIKDPGALATARKLEAIQIAIREMQQLEADLKVDLRSIAACHGRSVKIGSFLVEETNRDKNATHWTIIGDES